MKNKKALAITPFELKGMVVIIIFSLGVLLINDSLKDWLLALFPKVGGFMLGAIILSLGLLFIKFRGSFGL
ncbi:MAG: hypothetical protein WC933_03155 [Candidatus Paceibacterota bacterium]|jgi:hypothetical protein